MLGDIYIYFYFRFLKMKMQSGFGFPLFVYQQVFSLFLTSKSQTLKNRLYLLYCTLILFSSWHFPKVSLVGGDLTFSIELKHDSYVNSPEHRHGQTCTDGGTSNLQKIICICYFNLLSFDELFEEQKFSWLSWLASKTKWLIKFAFSEAMFRFRTSVHPPLFLG